MLHRRKDCMPASATPSAATSVASPVETLRALFQAGGHLSYGERVSQLDHALQGAQLAEAEGADDELVCAVLLHDLGHLLHRDAAQAFAAGDDDKHELLGARYLARWFGPGVVEPIAWHVQAKRYLCAVEAGYHASLSPVSQRTLAIQGGAMSAAEIADFEGLSHHRRAVAVRRWDDAAKEAGATTRPLDHFLSVAARVLR